MQNRFSVKTIFRNIDCNQLKELKLWTLKHYLFCSKLMSNMRRSKYISILKVRNSSLIKNSSTHAAYGLFLKLSTTSY